MKPLLIISTALLGISLVLAVLAVAANQSNAPETPQAPVTVSSQDDSLPQSVLSKDRELLGQMDNAAAGVEKAAVISPPVEQARTNASHDTGDDKVVLEAVAEGGKEVLDPKVLLEPIAELTEEMLPYSGVIAGAVEFLPPTTEAERILNEPNPENVRGLVVSPSSP